MTQKLFSPRRLALAGAALLLCTTAAFAQTGPSPARQAIEARKAVFTLIGSNCRALGDVVKGTTAFDAADVQKRAHRIAFLSTFLNESFPDVSNVGEPDTKTKAEAWTNHAEFAKKIKDFQDHANALVQVSATETSVSDAFKASFTSLAGDCKGCHEDFRVK
jgi:cytochrome c556